MAGKAEKLLLVENNQNHKEEVVILYPYTAERRDVLGCTSPTTEISWGPRVDMASKMSVWALSYAVTGATP